MIVQQASICISEPPESPVNDSMLLTTQLSINSPMPSPPPPPINISPGSPPTFSIEDNQFQQEQQQESPPQQQQQTEINGVGGEEEKETLLTSSPTNNNHNNVTTVIHPATINEEHEDGTKNKSSLSLPFEQTPTSPVSLTVTTSHSSSNGNSNHINSVGNHMQATIAKPSMCERSQSDRRKLSVSNIMSFGEQRRRSTSSIFSDMRKMSITNFDSLKSPGIGEIMSFILFYYFLCSFIH